MWSPQNITDIHWYNDPRFQRYWDYYYQSKVWFNYHLKGTNSQAADVNPYNTISSDAPPSPFTASSYAFADKCSDEYSDVEDVNPEDSKEEVEMVVTEEMVEFFAQSERYRRERDASKLRTEQLMAEEELVDLADVKPEMSSNYSVLPPSEQMKSQRTKEIKYLYGKDAAKIHGMETAMQLTFHRYCDTYQPKLWPNMPLKI